MIEQLARHLTPLAEVNLAVRRGPTRALDGVTVLEAPHLGADELPDVDVLIGGLAQPDSERLLDLPASKGVPLFLFQGYGTPGNPRVSELLRRRPRVLAVSSFVAQRAREHDCEVALVRPGLDRAIFATGEPCARRAPVVAMMTHAVDWKATQDGLAALDRVRAAVPEVEVRLFGASTPAADLGAAHLGELSRRGVAELLRSASVFVCPSLEEGLGLPGIEALACGAALATTDTQGGRDYAIDGETALVTPPGRPDLLAASVIRLLRAATLRGELARRGREQVLATYRPWPQTAASFHRAIATLLGGAPAPATPAPATTAPATTASATTAPATTAS